jgi:6-phosphogluconolactonase
MPLRRLQGGDDAMTPQQQIPADLVNGPTPAGGTRRTFLLGAAGGMATLAVGGAAMAAESTGTAFPAFAYIGCFTSATRKASAKGISVYRIDQGGDWTLQQTLETVPNPQFIAFDRQQKYL